MVTILLVNATFYWGFSIRTMGSSAASLSYLVLLPQTLIGALTWSLSKMIGLPETYRGASTTKLFIDRNVIVWGTARLKGLAVPHSDIIRMERSPYVREKYRADMARQFGVSSMGRMYAPSLRATIAYVVNVEQLKSLLEELRVSVTDVLELLKCAACSIIRIGSKESMVAIEDVKILTNVEPESNIVETSFYVPGICVSDVDGEYESISIPTYSESHYNIHGGIDIAKETQVLIPIERKSVLPTFGGRLRIKLKEGICVAVPVDDDMVVYPVEGIKGLR